MRRRDVDAVVASSPENVTYASEYWGLSHWARRGTQVYAVVWNEPARSVDLIVPAALADLVTETVSAAARIHVYGNFVLGSASLPDNDHERQLLELVTDAANPTSGPELLLKVLRARLGSGRVAVEHTGLADGALTTLADGLAEVELVDAGPLLREFRAVKSDQEVELLRRAAQITEQAAESALIAAHPGATETDIAQRFMTALIEQGALPETTVIGTGRRSALPNALPVERELRSGDVLRFDIGCRFGHYVSDIARCVALERVGGSERSLYRALANGLEEAAALLAPGVGTSEVYAAAMAAARRDGIPDYQRTHCGHGIGIANYDLPNITATSTEMLEPGMVICIETPYYRLGEFGLQVEDTFLITDDGAERFTQAPRELLILTDW
jgi:Xaa-Pro aminopeptidase